MYEIFYAKSLSNAVIIVNSRALERVFPRADDGARRAGINEASYQQMNRGITDEWMRQDSLTYKLTNEPKF
jgi:hypothetical protein